MADHSTSNGTSKDGAPAEDIIRVIYKCGDELPGGCDAEQTCGALTEIKTGDAIICRTCGHRLLYKVRTSRRT
eukprot:scaffold7381_cov310-Pinguiococcus_pyrenoidosus.AAC.86